MAVLRNLEKIHDSLLRNLKGFMAVVVLSSLNKPVPIYCARKTTYKLSLDQLPRQFGQR